MPVHPITPGVKREVEVNGSKFTLRALTAMEIATVGDMQPNQSQSLVYAASRALVDWDLDGRPNVDALPFNVVCKLGMEALRAAHLSEDDRKN